MDITETIISRTSEDALLINEDSYLHVLCTHFLHMLWEHDLQKQQLKRNDRLMTVVSLQTLKVASKHPFL